MNEMTRIIASLVFVSIWYAMTLIGRALFKPYEKLKLVWCPEARNFSFVEIVPTSKGSLRQLRSSVVFCGRNIGPAASDASSKELEVFGSLHSSSAAVAR